MQDSIHLNIAQCQFDWAELNLQLVPHLAEISIEITPLPETQGYWWSDLEYKYIPSSPGIYAIANVLNGDFYIGSAANLYQRKLEHVGKLQKNKHRNSHLPCRARVPLALAMGVNGSSFWSGAKGPRRRVRSTKNCEQIGPKTP